MRRGIARLGLLLAVAVLQACSDSPAEPGLSIDAAAVIRGVLFVDANGSGDADAGDLAASGWTVNLYGGNGARLTHVQTDSAGLFRIPAVPVGSVRLGVDPARLGDSLRIFRISPAAEVTLSAGDTAVLTIGLSYPRVALDSLAAVPLGRKVFVEGIALNGLSVSSPREIHLRGKGVALRTTDLDRQTIGVGDSVRVLGRRADQAGQPILNAGRVFLARNAVDVPQPLTMTTGEAASARGGAATAELARVRSASISAVRTDQDDVIVTVDDGSGSVEVWLRAFLAADAAAFDPTLVRIREVTGVLIPYLDESGVRRWRVAPRSASDVRTEAIPPA